MSSWGNRDNVTLTGTVTTSTSSNTVSGFGGAVFEDEVNAGDYIIIAANKYQVFKVVSNSTIYISEGTGTVADNAATTSANVTAYIQQGPKYISNTAANTSIQDNVYTIQNVYGVHRDEVGVPENQARGFSHTGWSHYQTYATSQGETRYKTEVLVAMSKNFDANATGTLAFDDADDDTVVANFLIYFTTQPSDNTVAANAAVTFSAAEASDPDGATITFQWQESPNNVTWSDVADGGVYSGNTSNTLVISDSTGLEDNYYRLVISGDGGADSNTSDVAQILFS